MVLINPYVMKSRVALSPGPAAAQKFEDGTARLPSMAIAAYRRKPRKPSSASTTITTRMIQRIVIGPPF
jgi:hypothetical protein